MYSCKCFLGFVLVIIGSCSVFLIQKKNIQVHDSIAFTVLLYTSLKILKKIL